VDLESWNDVLQAAVDGKRTYAHRMECDALNFKKYSARGLAYHPREIHPSTQ